MRSPASLQAALRQASESILQIWTRRYKSYHIVSKNENEAESISESQNQKLQPRRWTAASWIPFGFARLWSTVLIFIVVSVAVKVIFLRGPTHDGLLQKQDHIVRLIFPSAEPDSELCKTVLTAGILGYSAPIIVNYEPSLDAEGKHSEREFQRLKLTHDYLNGHGSSRDEDIVILLDSPYNWLQLRPEVMLSRYYRIINESNERLHQTIGKSRAIELGIQQSIVFAAQDTCSRHGSDELACLAVPNSPLSDIAALASLKHLSVGTVVGRLANLRTLFKHLKSKAERTMDNVDLQAIAEETFGKQEYRREFLRQQNFSFAKRVWHSIQKLFGSGRTALDQINGGRIVEDREETSSEFGIVLDYANELGLSVGEATDDVDWVQHGSASKLPVDLASSMPPFWTPTGNDIPTQKGWKDVDLLVDRRTGSIPAVINFPHNSSTPMQTHGWLNFWMRANAKTLFKEAVSIPRLPVATVVDSQKGVEHLFW